MTVMAEAAILQGLGCEHEGQRPPNNHRFLCGAPTGRIMRLARLSVCLTRTG